jgi:Ni,Fe-hydrogenase III large subunit
LFRNQKIKKLSNTHPSYNFQYIFSLVMSGKIAEANSIITSLDKQYRDNDLFQFRRRSSYVLL